MQRIAGPDALVGMQPDPTLTALRRVARIPSDIERLHSAAIECHEILLQRRHAERPSHLVVRHRAVRAFELHEERIASPEELRDRIRVARLDAGEVPEHGRRRRRLHRKRMVR